MKETAERELERGTRWLAVRSGLMVLAVTWTLSTLTNVGVQIAAINLGEAAASGNDLADVKLAALSNVNALVYSLFAIVFVFASLRLTRASPDSRAVTPALVAAVAFAAIAIVNTAVIVTRPTGEGGAAVTSDARREMLTLVVIGRAVAVVAISIALIRLAAARERGLERWHAGALLGAALIDTGLPLGRLLIGERGGASSGLRLVLTAVQIALAAMVAHVCLRTRQAIPSYEEPVRKKKGKKKKKKKKQQEAAEEAPVEVEVERLPPPTLNAMGLAGAVAAAAVGLLPVWDAFSHPELRVRSGVFVLAALALGYGLYRMMQSAPYGARGVFVVIVLASISYAAVTASEIAVVRSHEIDAWPVCESGFDIHGENIATASAPAGYEGPRTPEGIPCTRAAERRDQHEQDEPQGNIRDGLVQIGIRFANDRFRIFGGTFAIVLALIFSGVIVGRSARAVD